MRGWLSIFAFAFALGLVSVGCLDAPPARDAALVALVTTWDPLACGDPHRVAVELVDAAGATSAASAPCAIGVVTLDVAHVGAYTGRVYAWAIGEPARSITPITVTIAHEGETRQHVATPP
ncbi:MAG TPA: hypothetical protein VFP84_05370 [Kofleriaceae bacterium]|nr:hypothetical protein [Kofleriaceae bacterium]